MIFSFRGKWYIWVFPFQKLDLSKFFDEASGMIHVETIWIMRYGTLAGIRRITTAGKLTATGKTTV